MSKSITVTTEIAAERLAGLLCSGFEGGCGYWCQITGYRKPAAPVPHFTGDDTVYKHIDYPLCEDGAVLCRDVEDDERGVLVLDLAAIKRGLALMPTKAAYQWGRFVADDYDADTGDAFIQCCLLGEVVYG